MNFMACQRCKHISISPHRSESIPDTSDIVLLESGALAQLFRSDSNLTAAPSLSLRSLERQGGDFEFQFSASKLPILLDFTCQTSRYYSCSNSSLKTEYRKANSFGVKILPASPRSSMAYSQFQSRQKLSH